MNHSVIRIGIINVSDRASRGIYEDIPGKAIVATLTEYLKSPWEQEYAVIPDEQPEIERKLISMADDKKCCLIITSGGTGHHHFGRHRSGPPRRNTRSHGIRLQQDVARIWRIDAFKKSRLRAYGHPIPANGRYKKSNFNRKFARKTESHQAMPGCGFSCNSVLY